MGPIIRAMNHNRTRVVLLVLEIALTLAIVTNCVNVILAERAKMREPSGFDDDNIVWVHARPFAPENQRAFFSGVGSKSMTRRGSLCSSDFSIAAITRGISPGCVRTR